MAPVHRGGQQEQDRARRISPKLLLLLLLFLLLPLLSLFPLPFLLFLFFLLLLLLLQDISQGKHFKERALEKKKKSCFQNFPERPLFLLRRERGIPSWWRLAAE